MACTQNWRIETVAVAHHELDASLLARSHHAGAFFQRNGHGFFDPNMLAVLRGQFHMRGMKLMRCGDIDHFNFFEGTQFGHTSNSHCLKIFFKLCFGTCNGIGGRDQLNTGVLQEGGKHQSECAAQACNANLEWGNGGLRHVVG